MNVYLSDGRSVQIKWRHRYPEATECHVTVGGKTASGAVALAPPFSRPALRKRTLALALKTAPLTKDDRRDIWEQVRSETWGSWGRPLSSSWWWGRADWSKPSRAVVACSHGTGCVLYHTGAHIECEIDGVGSRRLDDLGLDDAPEGLSVWEGTYKTVSFFGDCGTDYDTEVEGTFRPLTQEEWATVQRGVSPW